MTFTIQTWSHERFGWIMLPLRVENTRLRMILSTGSGRSRLSLLVRDTLIGEEVLPPSVMNQYTLADIKLGDEAVGDLPIGVARESRIWMQADGMLGLDFLRRFSVIHFETTTLRLTPTLL